MTDGKYIHTYIRTDRQTGRQTGMHPSIRTYIHTYIQTDRQTDRHTHTHIHTYKHNVLKITCNIPMEAFSLNFKVLILITIYLVFCLKNIEFVVTTQEFLLRGVIGSNLVKVYSFYHLSECNLEFKGSVRNL